MPFYLWSLSECKMMLFQKYCSYNKAMTTKVPHTTHRNKPRSRVIGRKHFLTLFMNHWDRYMPRAELIQVITKVNFVLRNSFLGDQTQMNLLSTTESTALQQCHQCLVCKDSFIPAGKKRLFHQPTPDSAHTLLWGKGPLNHSSKFSRPDFQLLSSPAVSVEAQVIR